MHLNLLLNNSFHTVFIISLILIALAGCSSSGNSSNTSGNSTLLEDTNAPTASVSPDAGAVLTNRRAGITATFDEDLFATTVNTASFTVSDTSDSLVTGDVSYDPLTRTATFTPKQTLNVLSHYSAQLTDQITDLSGNALTPLSWKFSTGDGNWGESELLEDINTSEAFEVRLATDGNGHTLAIWQQDTTASSGGWTIMANTHTPATGWGTATSISTSTLATGYANIARNAAGAAIATWTYDDGNKRALFAIHYDPVTGWDSGIEIGNSSAGDSASVSIAINNKGEAVAVWSQKPVGVNRYDIWARMYHPVNGWNAATLIETQDLGHAIGTEAAINENGEAVVAWFQFDGSYNKSWVGRYATETGWSAAERLDNSASDINALPPKIVLDEAGNVLAVWRELSTTTTSLWSRYFSVENGWQTPIQIQSSTRPEISTPASIAITANGGILAAWSRYDGTDGDLFTAEYALENGWFNITRHSGDGNINGEIQIASDLQGNAFAAWSENDGIRQNIKSLRYINDTGWGTETLLEEIDIDDAYGVQISTKPSGSAVAAWYQDDGNGYSIRANSFE